MEEKLKELRDDLYHIRFAIKVEIDSVKKEDLKRIEAEILSEYKKVLLESKLNEGGKKDDKYKGR